MKTNKLFYADTHLAEFSAVVVDCFAGKHIGLRAIIVPPIKDKTNLFFRSKRLLERPFIRKYAHQNGYQEWMAFWKVKP
jgi:predicted HAD superfamily phosphohydrolase YqeG